MWLYIKNNEFDFIYTDCAKKLFNYAFYQSRLRSCDTENDIYMYVYQL